MFGKFRGVLLFVHVLSVCCLGYLVNSECLLTSVYHFYSPCPKFAKH